MTTKQFVSLRKQAVEWCNDWAEYHMSLAEWYQQTNQPNNCEWSLECATRAEGVLREIQHMSKTQLKRWINHLNTTGSAC